MSRPLVFVFPGQSSRDAGLFRRLDALSPGAGTQAQARAEAAMGRACSASFDHNLDIQCCVLAASLAWLRLAEAAGLRAQASAGLSLGEYAHLVHIGALDEAAAMALVAARGRCYDAGPSGAMAALFPMAAPEAQALCERVCLAQGDPQAVAVSNFNSPQQVVVAGTQAAVDAVLEGADAEHGVLGHVIERRIPMHVVRFEPVAQALQPALRAAPWQAPRLDYWPNVDGCAMNDVTPARLQQSLARHVHQPVRWQQTIDAMRQRWPDAVFVEVGPLQVLSRLMARRWLPAGTVFALDTFEMADAPGESGTSASPAATAAWGRRVQEIHDALAR
ncbi:ACP S-malonyltransferase [Rubrivivax rivuli]|uniref:Acyltransferase domain-containing protein n=1 Tax=Rubrivivax rivuli TaxID=1862385 RepID=A0A437RE76_9BURK|nr:acyltransferase domain-containing protein [Rubrivivax rivuli]RVU45044.1 acyltransferase domain-containing protein [Rubrivivax rivuli]